MKYNFDKKTERRHCYSKYSYAAKWMNPGKLTGPFGKMLGLEEIPEDVIPMFTADMDIQCAPEIVKALTETAQHGIFGYSVIPPEYFEAICGWFERRFGWKFTPDDIFPCSDGTHDAIVDCINCFTDPGDGVLVLTPSYNYHHDIEGNGRKFVGVPMKEKNGYYTIDYDLLEQACSDKHNNMLIFVQPHNPSGRVFTKKEIKKVGEICRKYGVIIVSDEVHIDLTRKGVVAEPLMKVLGPQGVISTTAINKTFNLAGLAMTNTIICDPYLKAHFVSKKFMLNPFCISAVIAAYNEGGEWVDQLNTYLDANIDYVAKRLEKDFPKAKMWKPEGTYIIWIDWSGYKLSDEELNKKFNAAHVMLSSGKGFDVPAGTQYTRAILATPKAYVEEAFDRLAKQFKK